MNYMDSMHGIYAEISAYCKANDCDAAKVQELIRDVLFPLGLMGESAQKDKLIQCADPRHHEAFWLLLKKYEAVALCQS